MISIEGSFEGLTKEEEVEKQEERVAGKRPAAAETSDAEIAAAKSAKKKAKKAARAKKANGDL